MSETNQLTASQHKVLEAAKQWCKNTEPQTTTEATRDIKLAVFSSKWFNELGEQAKVELTATLHDAQQLINAIDQCRNELLTE